MPITFLGTLWLEAAVVGVVCVFFLLLFVAAGIRQIIKDRNDNNGY
jgi:hypothetical protein